MKASEIKDYIESLTSHFLFIFNDKECGVDPFSSHNFDMWYGDNMMTAKSIDEVMNTSFFDGKTLNEISNEIELN